MVDLIRHSCFEKKIQPAQQALDYVATPCELPFSPAVLLTRPEEGP